MDNQNERRCSRRSPRYDLETKEGGWPDTIKARTDGERVGAFDDTREDARGKSAGNDARYLGGCHVNAKSKHRSKI
jgi:hypothetical protein